MSRLPMYAELYLENAERDWDQLRLKLIDARKEARMTQLDLATAIGVGLASVSAWELGRWAPNGIRLLMWLAVLDVEMDLRRRRVR